MTSGTPRAGLSRPGDRSGVTTRSVRLYQAQTVARPILPDPTTVAHPQRAADIRSPACSASEPATRCYPTGLLERLRDRPEPAAPAHPRSSGAAARARAAALGAAPCVLAAGALFVCTQLPVAPRLGAAAPAGVGAPRTSDVPAAEAAASTTPAGTAPAAAQPSPGVPPAPRTAAELLARGRYGEALDAYQRLARAHPERSVYAHMAAMIARRCAQRAARGDATCTREAP
jgi:hypothetical protein